MVSLGLILHSPKGASLHEPTKKSLQSNSSSLDRFNEKAPEIVHLRGLIIQKTERLLVRFFQIFFNLGEVEFIGHWIIHVLAKFHQGWPLGIHTRCGHFNLANPSEGIKDHLTVVVIAPVPMGMTTSITKTPAAIGTIAGPSKHLLFLAIKNSFANKRIVGMGAIATRKFAIFVNQSFGRRKCAKDWRNALHLGPESHVVIPFIMGFERVYTPGNRVVFSKIRFAQAPVWID